MDEKYDLIISIGQVVPHEVVGMANHAKNLFVGCGGSQMINASHMVGAVYGMERMMGRDNTPVRKIFDYGLENFLKVFSENLSFCGLLVEKYSSRMFQKGVCAKYHDLLTDEEYNGIIRNVEPDGRLHIYDKDNGKDRYYRFKEVSYIL